MTPAARLAAAIEIVDALENTAQPADRFIRDYFRTRRYAGSKDRAAVGERVFVVLRHRASLGWRMKAESPRACVIASLLAEGMDADGIAALFGGGGYGSAALSEEEKRALSEPPRPAPLWVQHDFPAFLEAELTRAFGGDLPAEMTAMLARAPVDLRVNTLKAAREDVLGTLRAQGFAAAPSLYAPHGIRLPPGEGAALDRTAEFLHGDYELQDEASQIAALLCGAASGERILDLAAGSGGKALALAAAMDNRGEIAACDIDAKRLAQLGPRAARAGASIIHPQLIAYEPPAGSFDAVLVDAPCSGSGVWRRQPELKWRLTPEKFVRLAAAQDGLLERAAPRVRPGGRLVYATCSIVPTENEDRVSGFLARHAEFAVLPAAEVWQSVAGTPLPPGMERFFRATPRLTGTDGFFAAILVREDKGAR